MTNMSNRGLTYLILMTLALSVLTTVISHQNIRGINEQLLEMGTPTGYAITSPQQGTAAINLSSSIAIALNWDTLNWGTGIANQTNPSCGDVILNTSGTTSAVANPNDCWTNTSTNGAIVERDDFIVENTGTTHINLTVNSSTSTAFFGFGSAATTDFQWHAVENESGSCEGSGLVSGSNEFTGTYQEVCGSMDYVNGNDAIGLEIYLRFNRTETTTGQRTATVYFRAENATI